MKWLAPSRQRAIAAVHAEAARPEDTDWEQIVGLYDVLLRNSRFPDDLRGDIDAFVAGYEVPEDDDAGGERGVRLARRQRPAEGKARTARAGRPRGTYSLILSVPSEP